jgi:hypothetical protein
MEIRLPGFAAVAVEPGRHTLTLRRKVMKV